MIVALLLILVPTFVCVAACYLVRRYLAPRGGHLGRVPSAPGIFGVVGTGFAVLLAFVILSSFSSYQTARQSAGAEAVAVRELSATAAYFPANARDDIRQQLVCYARAVEYDEWPKMQDGHESDQVERWIADVETSVRQADFDDTKSTAALGNWFTQSQERGESRRGRIAEAAPFVPPFVWVILLLLVAVVVAFQCLFADPDAPALGQLAAMGACAFTFFIALTLIWVIDRPFNERGAAIEPWRIHLAGEAVAVVLSPAQRDTLPCTSTGAPTS